MAEVVHRAVFDNVSAPSDNVEIVTSFGTVRLPAADVAAVVATVLERSRRYSDGRQLLRERLVELAWVTHVAKSTSDVTRQARFRSRRPVEPRPQKPPGQDVAHHHRVRCPAPALRQ